MKPGVERNAQVMVRGWQTALQEGKFNDNDRMVLSLKDGTVKKKNDLCGKFGKWMLTILTFGCYPGYSERKIENEYTHLHFLSKLKEGYGSEVTMKAYIAVKGAKIDSEKNPPQEKSHVSKSLSKEGPKEGILSQPDINRSKRLTMKEMKDILALSHQLYSAKAADSKDGVNMNEEGVDASQNSPTIDEIDADLIQAFEGRNKPGVILHCCNTKGDMGGFAGKIAKKFPPVVEADNNTRKSTNNLLGNYSMATIELPREKVLGSGAKFLNIINLYGQLNGGKVEDPDALYLGIKAALYKVKSEFLDTLKIHGKPIEICMPKMGSGIAGGSWKEIVKILNEVFDKDYKITVYSLEKRQKA